MIITGMAQQYLLALLGLCTFLFVRQSDAFLGFGAGKSSVVIDSENNPDGSIEVHQICDPSETKQISQITRIKTIQWLNTLVQDSGSRDSEGSCLLEYIEPVRELNEIIEASKPDACNEKHISMVERFHLIHIEPQLMKYKIPIDGQKVVPEPLKWFFIHYATKLSKVCRQNFLDNLELISKKSDAEYNSMLSGVSGRFINGIETIFGPDAIEKDEDFILLWNMGNRYNHKIGIKPELGLGNSKALMLKMKSVHDIKQIQAKCRDHLKPIYRETALSSMRLIDLGYTINAKTELPTANKQFQNWYSIVQACEYLLPISFYKDSQLEPEEVIIISKEEAVQLTEAVDQIDETEQVSFTKKPADSIDVSGPESQDEPTKLLKQIKSNLRNRMKNFKRIMINLLKKSVIEGRLKKFLISRKSEDGKKFVKTSAKPFVKKILNEAESEENSADVSEDHVALERHVRAASDRRHWFRQWCKDTFNRHPLGMSITIFFTIIAIMIIIAICVG